MKRLDRYFFSEVAMPFLAAQTVFVVLFLGTDAMTEATKLIARYGLPWLGVMRLLLLRMPWALAWTMPMSTGMAVIMGIGRMCRDGEYTASIVGGISFRRMMVSMMLFAGAVSALALWVQEYAGPATMMEYHTSKLALQAEARADLLEFHYRLNDYRKPERIVIEAERLDTQEKTLATPSLTVTEGGVEKYRVVAEKAVWDMATRQWDLLNGRWTIRREGQSVEGSFERSTVRDLARQAGYTGTIVFEDSPNEIAVYSTEKPDYLIGPLIRKRIAWMKRQHYPMREVNRVVIYLHRRYALATSCLMFLMVGAPLAVRPQRGASRGGSFALALALILAYYIVWQSTSLLGEGSRFPLAWAWSTNIIGALIGLAMWRRVPD